MQNKRPRILCTRPLPESLLETAASQGVDITVEAFTEIHPIVSKEVADIIFPLLQQRITLVFTSAHAVEILEKHYLQQPTVPGLWDICCLEAGTLDAVKEALPQCTIKATAANATALANAITALGDVKEVYFICGKQRRDELPNILQQHNITVHELVVYENAATPAKMDTAYDGIFFFSPSAVQSFFSANTLPAATICFAIGETTAAALRTAANNKIIISGSPSAAALLAAATAYFNKP